MCLLVFVNQGLLPTRELRARIQVLHFFLWSNREEIRIPFYESDETPGNIWLSWIMCFFVDLSQSQQLMFLFFLTFMKCPIRDMGVSENGGTPSSHPF